MSACSSHAPKELFPILRMDFTHSKLSFCLAPEDSSQSCAWFCSWHYSKSWCNVVHCLRPISHVHVVTHISCHGYSRSLDLLRVLWFQISSLGVCCVRSEAWHHKRVRVWWNPFFCSRVLDGRVHIRIASKMKTEVSSLLLGRQISNKSLWWILLEDVA